MKDKSYNNNNKTCNNFETKTYKHNSRKKRNRMEQTCGCLRVIVWRNKTEYKRTKHKTKDNSHHAKLALGKRENNQNAKSISKKINIPHNFTK